MPDASMPPSAATTDARRAAGPRSIAVGTTVVDSAAARPDHVIELRVARVHPDAVVPQRQHPGDAGVDLCAVEPLTIAPGEWARVRTGLSMAIPDGWVGLVHPRSGLAARNGVTVLNAPGTIDAGYRGEVQVLLINHGPQAFEVAAGDRIAQLLVQRVGQAEIVITDDLGMTERADGGFGSTGR